MEIKKHAVRLASNSRLWRCFFIALALLIVQSVSLAQGVSVSPSRLFFTGAAGQELSQQITLTNTGKHVIVFKTSLMDWSRDSVGEKHYSVPGNRPLSNAKWVEVMPNVIEIQPGSKQQVTVTLHVPKTLASPTAVTNSMLFLTQINAQQPTTTVSKGNANIGVIIKLEFGVHIYYTPPVLMSKDLDFLAFYDEGIKQATDQKVRRVAVRIKNKGNVVTDGFLNFEVTNKITGEEIKPLAKAISMLPNDEQVVYLDLPADITGKYLIVALLDGGEETSLKVAKKELEFTK